MAAARGAPAASDPISGVGRVGFVGSVGQARGPRPSGALRWVGAAALVLAGLTSATPAATAQVANGRSGDVQQTPAAHHDASPPQLRDIEPAQRTHKELEERPRRKVPFGTDQPGRHVGTAGSGPATAAVPSLLASFEGVLGRTCSNTGAFAQVTSGLSVGHAYTLTLISHDDNFAGDATFTYYDDVAVLAPVANPVQNPGFETGTLSGWTAAGVTSVTTSTPHSGTFAAMLGSSSPTNGDSSVAQTFTAPTASSTLSFWYRNVCPDTVQFDWATATLTDNTAGTTRTVLAKTCTASGVWTQVSASVTAGHSYTLKVVNHDDNFAGDATFTQYDDVIVR